MTGEFNLFQPKSLNFHTAMDFFDDWNILFEAAHIYVI